MVANWQKEGDKESIIFIGKKERAYREMKKQGGAVGIGCYLPSEI